MRQLRLFPDNPPGPRWISPPWTTASDRWLEIELDLPVDHRARRFAEIVAELDLTALVGSYAGLGSPAYPPELLVRLALFEIHRDLQPVDRGSGGPVLVPDLRDVLMPVKPTVRHIRRSS